MTAMSWDKFTMPPTQTIEMKKRTTLMLTQTSNQTMSLNSKMEVMMT
jgi:hypothetical protein